MAGISISLLQCLRVMDDDNLFSHNLRFLISSSIVMIYGLMQSIRKELCNFWKFCVSKCGKANVWGVKHSALTSKYLFGLQFAFPFQC